MAAGRKTTDVNKLRERINTMIVLTDDNEPYARQALAILLEAVLHDTGNYKGYRYHSDQYLPACDQTRDNVLVENYDDTKRYYF